MAMRRIAASNKNGTVRHIRRFKNSWPFKRKDDQLRQRIGGTDDEEQYIPLVQIQLL